MKGWYIVYNPDTNQYDGSYGDKKTANEVCEYFRSDTVTWENAVVLKSGSKPTATFHMDVANPDMFNPKCLKFVEVKIEDITSVKELMAGDKNHKGFLKCIHPKHDKTGNLKSVVLEYSIRSV